MSLLPIQKQPSEVIVGVGINFKKRFARGETIIIESCQVMCDDPNLIITGVGAINDTILVATIGGGIDGVTYKVTYRAAGSLGSLREGEISVVVAEV